MHISRRKFLEGIGAVAAVCMAGDLRFAFQAETSDFEYLVVGDSLISGQGLQEKDKAYELTRTWLENVLLAKGRKLSFKNKSHSGSRLFLKQDELDAMNAAGKDLGNFYHPEVNFSFPSIKTQIDVAAKEYIAEGKSGSDIDLVLLSGSLTDISSSYILNGFKKYGPLHKKIEEHCNEGMFRFLKHGTGVFPNALFIVIGYFPMVSEKSSTGQIYNVILELYKFPGPTKPVLNNIVTKQLFKILHARITKRSRIWFEESTAALKSAVKRINEHNGKTSAVFVDSPIPLDRSFGTKDSLLWRMGKKGRSEDEMYDLRQIQCAKEIASVKDTGQQFAERFCELSGIGHPNPEGSRMYAEAIQKKLIEVWK